MPKLCHAKATTLVPLLKSPKACALALHATPELAYTLVSVSIDKSAEFLTWLAVVATVETHWKADAISPQAAYGLLQVTEAGAEEARLACHLLPIPTASLLNAKTNILYGSCLLKFYHKEAEEFMQGKTEEEIWIGALILYNGGYRQLTRWQVQGTLVAETAAYIQAAKQAKEICK